MTAAGDGAVGSSMAGSGEGSADSSGGAALATEPRAAVIAEAAVVVALGLGSVWLIRAQTTQGPVLGLPPAFLPTVCAIAIIGLALVGAAARLWRPEPVKGLSTVPVWPAAMLLGLALAGTLALQLAGPFVSGLVTVAIGLVLLRERRVPVLIGTLAVAVVILGAIQVWH